MVSPHLGLVHFNHRRNIEGSVSSIFKRFISQIQAILMMVNAHCQQKIVTVILMWKFYTRVLPTFEPYRKRLLKFVGHRETLYVFLSLPLQTNYRQILFFICVWLTIQGWWQCSRCRSWRHLRICRSRRTYCNWHGEMLLMAQTWTCVNHSESSLSSLWAPYLQMKATLAMYTRSQSAFSKSQFAWMHPASLTTG